MSITLRNQILKWLLGLGFTALLALRLAIPINLTEVDIGRYIKNGELLLQGQTAVLYKNFYSFTCPDYSFINHHWFFGLIAYFFYHVAGFRGLSVFYIILLVLAFLLFFAAARRLSNFSFAAVFAALAFIMLTSRAEVRPEGISIFLMGLYFYLLLRFQQKSLPAPILFWVIIPVQILWVNTHIFFIMGPILVAIFLWQAKISSLGAARLKALQRLLIASILVNLINPSGLWGMLTPLNGLRHFGYPLAENQTIFFMMKRFPHDILYSYTLFPVVLLAVGMVWACRRDGIKKHLPMLVLAGIVMAAGLMVVRMIMFFGFFFIVLAAYFYRPLLAGRRWTRPAAVVLTIAGLAWGIQGMAGRPALGLVPAVNASAEFFKHTGLKGPVFNNYDIGGYLIYHLAPQEKIFVDNRQEAFPPDFFSKIYIPMQQNSKVWAWMEQEYGFNVVYFDRHDMTPWGQKFLIDRVKDPQWAPVFVDDYTIIFARRGSINQPVIDRFELPKTMFGVVRLG